MASMSFFIGTVPNWIVLEGESILTWGFLAAAVFLYLFLRPGRRFQTWMRRLLIASLILQPLHAAYLSGVQYFVWSQSEFGQLFLPPNQSWAYYARYVTDHFWLHPVLGIVLAGLWYGFMRALKSRSERYLDVGELELTTLLILIAGWPDALVLAPAAGIAVIMVSIVRLTVFREKLTTLGIPFMIAAAFALLYGGQVRSLLGA